MRLKRTDPLIRFLTRVVIIGACHFTVFAPSYFFYRKSYYRVPTAFQTLCGVISQVLGYPLWLVKLVPAEPSKLLVLAASVLNSLVYAIVLAVLFQLFRRLSTGKPSRSLS